MSKCIIGIAQNCILQRQGFCLAGWRLQCNRIRPRASPQAPRGRCSALRFSHPKAKAMKASKPKAVGVSASGRQLVVRVSDEQYQRLADEAETAGLSVSECVRRHVFGGRPIVANSDTRLLNAVRSIGGLLKHNFQTLRDTAPPLLNCLPSIRTHTPNWSGFWKKQS